MMDFKKSWLLASQERSAGPTAMLFVAGIFFLGLERIKTVRVERRSGAGRRGRAAARWGGAKE